MAAGQADEVVLAVADEGHPLLDALLAERSVGVHVDQVRLGVDGHAVFAQLADALPHVGHAQVDQGARRGLLEQQPRAAKPDERESRRFEPGDQLAAKHGGIELDRAIKVLRALSYLVQFDHVKLRSGAARWSGLDLLKVRSIAINIRSDAIQFLRWKASTDLIRRHGDSMRTRL